MKITIRYLILLGAAGACNEPAGAPPPPPQSPTGFTFETREGGFSSFGWTGAFHHITGAVGAQFGVKVTACDDGPNGTCRFEGPTDPVGPVNRRRCLYRTSITCTSDSDCPPDTMGKPLPCVYIYDPPLATPLSGNDNAFGGCTLSYIPIAAAGAPPTITGTLDLSSGDLNLENLTVLLPANAYVNTAVSPPVSGFAGVCAECVGDPTPNDGLKQGHCVLGSHMDLPHDGKHGATDPSQDLGQPCDVNRFGTIDHYEGAYSMDCSPTFTPGLGTPIQFGGAFSSRGFAVSVDSQSPTCELAADGTAKCFCAMCPDGKTPCSSSSDCGGATCGQIPDDCDPNPFPFHSDGTADSSYVPPPMFAIGQCRGARYQDPVPPTVPPTHNQLSVVVGNACLNDQCNWDEATDTGSCPSRYADKHMVACFPFGLGASITSMGRAERDQNISTNYLVDTASSRCEPATQSAAFNAQQGLPGLIFQKRNFRIIPHGGQP